MNRPIATLAAAAGLVLAAATASRADQFYASKLITRQLGSPYQAANQDTNDLLGGPSGASGFQQSLKVLNLGVSGSATVGFDDPAGLYTRAITNGAGADFIVFENTLYAGGSTTAAFAELVFVEVSSNGIDFARFPTLSLTASPVNAFGTINPANVDGFAGVHPTLANVDGAPNGIDPFDPAVAGGDAFDLSDLSGHALAIAGLVDLNAIRYVRMVDVLGDGTQLDTAGNPIYDPTGAGNGGADIDSIAVIHGVTSVPEPGSVAFATLAGAVLLWRRGRRS